MEKETGNVRRYGINQTENALALAGSIGGKSGLKPPAGTLSAEGIIPRFTDFLEDELDSLGCRLTDTVSETQSECVRTRYGKDAERLRRQDAGLYQKLVIFYFWGFILFGE